MSTPSTKRKDATKRAKVTKLTELLRDDEALANAISRYASLELTEESLKLEAEAELQTIQERHAAKIKKVADERAELFEQIETFTRKNKDTLFKGEERTVKINGHELSVRLGNLTVTAAKGHTQKQILADLIEHDDEAWADGFVRWTETLNKEAIIEQWDATTNAWKPGAEGLKDLGVEIEQLERVHLKTARALSAGVITKSDAVAA